MIHMPQTNEIQLLYREYGHKGLLTKLRKELLKTTLNAKEMMFDFNNTRPSDMETRTKNSQVIRFCRKYLS